MAKYDIVVVGAGNAGMSAALNVSWQGKGPLLIEQHNLPGGAATSCRGALEIEPSCTRSATTARRIIPATCAR